MPWDAAMLFTLWLLLFGHIVLIRGCFSIKDAFDPVGSDLRLGLDDVTAHLRESIEVLGYIADGLPDMAAPTAPDGPGNVLTALMSSMLMPKPYGTAQVFQGTVLQNDRDEASALA